jgi:hypothetical protein
MDRYRKYGPGDDVPLNDGDGFFRGFYSRFQPTSLTQGQAFYSGNMRMDRGTCRVRKGLKSLATDIVQPNPPPIADIAVLALNVLITLLVRVAGTVTADTAIPHGYLSGDRINISGAAQNEYNGDFNIVVTTPSQFTYAIATTPFSPASGTIVANNGPLLTETTSTQVVGSGDYADTLTNTTGIVMALEGLAYLYRDGLSAVAIGYPAGETCDVGAPCDLVQFLGRVFLFRGYQYAEPQDVVSISHAAGVATVVTPFVHNLAVGQWVTIEGGDQYGYRGLHQITAVPTPTSYQFAITGAPVTPGTGTFASRPSKPPLVWDMDLSGSPAFEYVLTGPHPFGAPLIRMPAVDWGMYFVGRMVLPYARDQLIISDIFDAETYDPSQTQFRLLPGTADWLIAAFPFQDARLLVLYRKSVHLQVFDNTDLSISQAFEITRGFGCVARRTVANCGPYIVWLSDLGVVRMSVSEVIELRNTAAPLSDPIDDVIRRINWAYAGTAVSAFWNNRYYLAVPLDSATENNTVLVYNFLNEAWESVDTYPGAFDVLNFHILDYNGEKRLHAVSKLGYVSLLEELDVDEFGPTTTPNTFPILGSLKTRNYLAQTYDVKRVRRFQLEMNMQTGDQVQGQYILSNPDGEMDAFTLNATSPTDISVRAIVNRRGVSGRLEITTTGGRPEFKTIVAESTVNSRATLSYR